MTNEPITLQISSGGPHPVRFEVELDQLCATCEGYGRVASEAWLDWLAKYNRAEADLEVASQTVPGMTRAEIVDRASAVAGPEPTEPEEPTCPACDGLGRVPTEAGAAILKLVRRHV